MPLRVEPSVACRCVELLARAPTSTARRRAPARRQHLDRERLVARAEDADRERCEHDRGRDQAVGREVVARSDPERRARSAATSDERRDDLPDARATLARRIQAACPEDEHRDQREERKPLRLGVPEDAPEDSVRPCQSSRSARAP